MSHATFIHFPSLKLVLFISSKLTKRCLPPPPFPRPEFLQHVPDQCIAAVQSLANANWKCPNEVIGCNPQLGGVPGLPKLLWKQAWKRTKPTNIYIGHENKFEMTKQEQLPSIIPTPSTLLCFLAKAWRAASSRKGTAALDSLNLQESKICVLHSCWVSSFKKIIWDTSEYGSLSSSLFLWTRINLLMTHLLLFKLYRRQLHHSHTCNQPPEPVESRLTSSNDFEVPSKWTWKSKCRQKIGPLGMSSFIYVALIIYIYILIVINHNQFLKWILK